MIDIIAEIYNKISKTGSNLTERLEDQLTGNFFGSLRYLPFEYGIKRILQKSVYPAELLDCIDCINLNEWEKNIFFWGDCRYEGTEPDVIIELDDVVILIEVKLDSSVAETQLEREADLLLAKYPHCSKKFLILLARERYSEAIYEERRNDIANIGVNFGYMTWQRVFTELRGINSVNHFQEVVVNDLIALLDKKGFAGFKGFGDYIFDIDPDDRWEFRHGFSFGYCVGIEGDLHYEFK